MRINALKGRSLGDPVFFLLFSCYLYGTCGYWGHQLLTINAKFLTLGFSEQAFAISYRLTAAALLMIYIGGAITDPSRIPQPIKSNANLAKVAFFFSAISVVLAVDFFIASGAFRGVSHADILSNKKQPNSVPYMLLLAPAFSILCLKINNKQRWLVSTIVLPFLIVNFMSGSRRHVLSLLIIITAASILRGWKFKWKHFILISGCFILLGLFVGATRGNTTPEMLFSDPTIFWKRIQFGLTEFTRPYTALLYYIDTTDTRPILLGSTFTDSLSYLIPSVVRTYDLPVRASSAFAQDLSIILDFHRTIGHGFYPIAEAIINFPIVFSPFIFLILSTITGILTKYFHNSRQSFMIPVLCVINFTVGRGGFQSIAYFFTYTLLIGTIILLTYSVLQNGQKKSQLENARNNI